MDVQDKITWKPGDIIETGGGSQYIVRDDASSTDMMSLGHAAPLNVYMQGKLCEYSNLDVIEYLKDGTWRIVVQKVETKDELDEIIETDIQATIDAAVKTALDDYKARVGAEAKEAWIQHEEDWDWSSFKQAMDRLEIPEEMWGPWVAYDVRLTFLVKKRANDGWSEENVRDSIIEAFQNDGDIIKIADVLVSEDEIV